MRGIVYLLVSVVCCRNVASQSAPQSPCPQVMRYERYGSQWTGIIEAADPPPYGSQMKLQVKMSIAAQLTSQYLGKIDLAEDRATVLNKINNGDPILYRVTFPLTYPIPRMVRIVFNNRVICTGPPASSIVVTGIDLEHVLNSGNSGTTNNRPSNNNNANPDYVEPVNNNYNPPPQPIIPRPRPTPPRTPAPVTINYARPATNNEQYDQPSDTYNSIMESKQICGETGKFTSLILGGEETEKGDWPWLAALYRNQNTGLQFICAGSLISNRVVLTAAHCTQKKDGSTTRASELIVKMGVYRLKDWADSTTQTTNVIKVVIHPNFSKQSQPANDIAIFKLEVIVTFNQFVKPVCLWDGNDDQYLVYGKVGSVVGWGEDENRAAIINTGPRLISVPIVNDTTCRLSNSQLFDLDTSTRLCGGERDGIKGPCRGDSGGGLYMRQNNKWTVRGVVSFALSSTDSPCDLRQYFVYTDAAKYTNWIYNA